MPHVMLYNPELQLIEITYQGNISLEEIMGTFREAIRLAQEHNCFLTLGDYRNAKVTLTTVEIHQLPKALANIMAPLGISPHRLKRAFVVAKDLEDFHFFETVTLNSGQNAHVFQSAEEARKWLSQK